MSNPLSQDAIKQITTNPHDFIKHLTPDEILKMEKLFSQQKDEAKKQRKINAYLQIEKLMDDLNMTIEDFMDIAEEVNTLRSRKYTDGKGNFYSGRGKKPDWLRQELDKGKKLEDLEYKDKSVIPLNDREKEEPKSEQVQSSQTQINNQQNHR